MWDFEHAPLKAELAARYALHPTTPAQCAQDLAAGRADIGLIPAAAYATIPGLAIIPGCAIASRNQVRSILLVVKLVVKESGGSGDQDNRNQDSRNQDNRNRDSGDQDASLKGVRSIAADTSSRSSLAYAEILFRKFIGTRPAFIQHPPALEAMLQVADAALLIGDPALLALEQKAEIEARTGHKYLWLDLAEQWRARTGLPWVAAFWAIRPESIAGSGITAAQVVQDMQSSRDHGLLHIEDLVKEWTPRISIPAFTIRAYLTQNIHYTLDEDCIAALKLFYRYAAECNALPAAPPLRFL